MKTLIKFLACAIALLCSVCAYADKDKDENIEGPTIITIVKTGTIIGRSLDDVPQAYYSCGSIHVSFNSAVEGDVYVTVTKLETGETINEVLDMNCGTFVVDIADIVSSGNYVINFMCPDSDAYTGTFSL